LPQSTLKRYLALLETTFLVHFLPPWHSNMGKRLVKSPKVLLTDTGLTLSLLGANPAVLSTDLGLFGPMLESFVAMEFLKQCTWSRNRCKMYHYRTQTGHEVDIVLEDDAGRIVGVEVKSSATLRKRAISGLKALREASGDRFLRGIILYTGREVIPFGGDISAVPVGALWKTSASTI
jgi:predicted AAA+ superfamily ATPase